MHPTASPHRLPFPNCALKLLRMEAEAEGKVEARHCYLLAHYLKDLLKSLPLGTIPGVDKPAIEPCEEDCSRCSGEYCEQHFADPCDCDVAERHQQRASAVKAALPLQPGLNIMDLAAYSDGLQQLAIANTLDWISAHESGVIVLIPEAAEFLAEGRDSACKSAAIRMARKGACVGNYLWIDSQELASVCWKVRKQVSCYLLGVQRDPPEVKRTLSLIPPDCRKPNAKGIMELRQRRVLGHLGFRDGCHLRAAGLARCRARAGAYLRQGRVAALRQRGSGILSPAREFCCAPALAVFY